MCGMAFCLFIAMPVLSFIHTVSGLTFWLIVITPLGVHTQEVQELRNSLPLFTQVVQELRNSLPVCSYVYACYAQRVASCLQNYSSVFSPVKCSS